jgi:protein-L-isoaspartate O-methyltransferase
MLSLLISLVLAIFCLIVLWYFYQGPAFVPTLKTTVEQMVAVSEIKAGMKAADLGSGDGRVVIAMAKAGGIATGFEINPFLVWYSRSKIRKLGFSDRVKIQSSSFWNQDLGEYDIITIFGINHVMERLGQKLALELKPGAVVISNAFRIPRLTEVKRSGSLLVYKR